MRNFRRVANAALAARLTLSCARSNYLPAEVRANSTEVRAAPSQSRSRRRAVFATRNRWQWLCLGILLLFTFMSTSSIARSHSLRFDLYILFHRGAQHSRADHRPATCDSLTLARPCLRCCVLLNALGLVLLAVARFVQEARLFIQ